MRDGGGDGAKAFLNVNSFGPRPTFIENFNPFSPTDGVIGSNYLYDTLGYADVNNKYEIVPWLAESIDFDPEARTGHRDPPRRRDVVGRREDHHG